MPTAPRLYLDLWTHLFISLRSEMTFCPLCMVDIDKAVWLWWIQRFRGARCWNTASARGRPSTGPGDWALARGEVRNVFFVHCWRRKLSWDGVAVSTEVDWYQGLPSQNPTAENRTDPDRGGHCKLVVGKKKQKRNPLGFKSLSRQLITWSIDCVKDFTCLHCQ